MAFIYLYLCIMTPQELAEMKAYFASKELPDTLQYNECTFMTDVRKSVNSDIFILEKYGFHRTYIASWERLVNVRNMLEEK